MNGCSTMGNVHGSCAEFKGASGLYSGDSFKLYTDLWILAVRLKIELLRRILCFVL